MKERREEQSKEKYTEWMNINYGWLNERNKTDMK
jgi:hypothetical protein